MNAQEQELKTFIQKHEAKLIPLYKERGQAWWEFETTGTKEAKARKEKAENAFKLFYSDSESYETLKSLNDSGHVNDALLKRQMVLLLDNYKKHQLPEDLIRRTTKIANDVDHIFNTYRGDVDGERVSQNDVSKVLAKSEDSEERRKYWEAQKGVAPLVVDKLKELIKLRNQAAQTLGYDNYYDMALDLEELDKGWLLQTFDRLYEMTETSFVKAKAEIDAFVAKRFGISTSEVMPWHYADPFFQSCPRITEFDYDEIYERQDIIPLAKKFYKGIGLPIEDILSRSDMHEREGKCEHAFCDDFDREGDVRILMNILNNQTEMGTLLHEAGHGVYFQGFNPQLPFLLRDCSHTFTTEAVAMMFGKLSYSGKFMQDVLGLSDDEANEIEDIGKTMVRNEMMVFSRWAQVMVRFEQAMYDDPEQDLNKLWWDLKEKYQHVRKPEGRDAPDFAAKIHLCVAPVYYHNYQLGELFASQIHDFILNNITNEGIYNNNPEVGQYLLERVFWPGASLKWDALVKHATDEELSPKFFAEQYT